MTKQLLILITLLVIGSSNAYATHGGPHSPFGTIVAPYGTTAYGQPGGLGKFIGNTVAAATIIAGLGFMAFLIFGAYRYLTSAGDEKVTAEARKTITYAFIGLVIVVLALAITAVVQAILGIDILNPTFRGP